MAVVTIEFEYWINDWVVILCNGLQAKVTSVFIDEQEKQQYRCQYVEENKAIHETYFYANDLNAVES